MGIFYSLGIAFNKEAKAQAAKAYFEAKSLRLSSGKELRLSLAVHAKGLDNHDAHLAVYPIGLSIPTQDPALLTESTLLEVRDQLYEHLLSMGIDFLYALFDKEAADTLLSWDIREDLTSNDLGPAYEGLLISPELYTLTLNKSLFTKLENGYYKKGRD